MGDGVYHLDPTGTLRAMTSTPYENAETLSGLVQSHPGLLAGEQLTPEAPRRWALVLPATGGSTGRRGVSLYVDQDGVPTLVSTSGGPEACDETGRRAVVGQVLDLAANGLRHWPVEELQATYETTQRRLGQDPAAVLDALRPDPGLTSDTFFDLVEDNLALGRIRIVFVAHQIPVELRRIIELLSDQLSPAEVFGVEVRQYRTDAYAGAVLVPELPARTPVAPTHLAPDEPAEPVPPRSGELVEKVGQLAAATGLEVVETSDAVSVRTREGDVLVTLDLTWDSVSVPMQRLPAAEVDAATLVLGRLTRARLDPELPSVPAQRVVTRWDEVRPMLERLARARQEFHPNGHRH